MKHQEQSSERANDLRRSRYLEYLRSALLVSQHPSIRRCNAVKELVDIDWYVHRYMRKQSNMLLVRNKPLPGNLLGLVVRRNVEWKGETRGLFLIQVARIDNVFEERFVIAHELGHVLLHGRLMYPGMVMSEARWDRSEEEDDRRRLVELEANLYALSSVVPHRAIEALHQILDRDVSPSALKHAMQWLGRGMYFDERLAQERLVLDKALSGRLSEDQFGREIWTGCSWTFDGTRAFGAAHESAASEPDEVSEDQLYAWLSVLLNDGVLNPAHWKGIQAHLSTLACRNRRAARAASTPSREHRTSAPVHVG